MSQYPTLARASFRAPSTVWVAYTISSFNRPAVLLYHSRSAAPYLEAYHLSDRTSDYLITSPTMQIFPHALPKLRSPIHRDKLFAAFQKAEVRADGHLVVVTLSSALAARVMLRTRGIRFSTVHSEVFGTPKAKLRAEKKDLKKELKAEDAENPPPPRPQVKPQAKFPSHEAAGFREMRQALKGLLDELKVAQEEIKVNASKWWTRILSVLLVVALGLGITRGKKVQKEFIIVPSPYERNTV